MNDKWVEKREKGEELRSNSCLSEIPKAPGVWIMKCYSVPEPQTLQVFTVISSRSTFSLPGLAPGLSVNTESPPLTLSLSGKLPQTLQNPVLIYQQCEGFNRRAGGLQSVAQGITD